MSLISSISTNTWIALGAAGIGAGIGAKVAHDHDSSWLLGAAIGGTAGFAGAKLLTFGLGKLNSHVVQDAAKGVAGLTSSAGGAAAASTRELGSVAGTTLADDMFRAAMLNHEVIAGGASAAAHAAPSLAHAAPASTHATTMLARLLAANTPTVAEVAPRVAAPVVSYAIPAAGGRLAALLSAFVH